MVPPPSALNSTQHTRQLVICGDSAGTRLVEIVRHLARQAPAVFRLVDVLFVRCLCMPVCLFRMRAQTLTCRSCSRPVRESNSCLGFELGEPTRSGNARIIKHCCYFESLGTPVAVVILSQAVLSREFFKHVGHFEFIDPPFCSAAVLLLVLVYRVGLRVVRCLCPPPRWIAFASAGAIAPCCGCICSSPSVAAGDSFRSHIIMEKLTPPGSWRRAPFTLGPSSARVLGDQLGMCDAEYKIFLRLRMSRLVFFEGIGCFPESEMPTADWWDGRLVLEPIRRCFGTTASWYGVPKLR